jgi:hypothetical protein
VGLSDVVTALCARGGLSASDLDVGELTDEVRGYGVARQVSLRGALELLAVAYNFDCVESDHKLRFRKRGRPVSRVIAEARRECSRVHREVSPRPIPPKIITTEWAAAP